MHATHRQYFFSGDLTINGRSAHFVLQNKNDITFLKIVDHYFITVKKEQVNINCLSHFFNREKLAKLCVVLNIIYKI